METISDDRSSTSLTTSVMTSTGVLSRAVTQTDAVSRFAHTLTLMSSATTLAGKSAARMRKPSTNSAFMISR